MTPNAARTFSDGLGEDITMLLLLLMMMIYIKKVKTKKGLGKATLEIGKGKHNYIQFEVRRTALARLHVDNGKA